MSEQKATGFINPYHFVPLGADRDPQRIHGPQRLPVSEQRGNLYGKIECKLTLKTPLAIPDHEKGEANYQHVAGHSYYPFYTVQEKPFIPGSELRGMVRSVYEAATDSCLGVFDNTRLTARQQKIKRDGGLIYRKGDQWYLQPAEVENVSTGGYRGSEGDIILRGEKSPKGNGKVHIFYPKRVAPFKIDKARVDALKEVVKCYRQTEVNKTLEKRTHSGYKGYEIKEDGGKTPVFYADLSAKRGPEEPHDVYLSPAMIGREGYVRRLHEVAGEYAPCAYSRTGKGAEDRKDCLCPACALFGTMRDAEAAKAEDTEVQLSHDYGSAVRFSDGLWQGKKPKYEKVTLKELSGPKITSTEFYLHLTSRKQADRIWNPDYKIVDGGRIVSLRSDEIALNGRKFYWHQPALEKKESLSSISEAATKRNMTTQLLMPGNDGNFTFTVYFDGITEKQLKDLIWAISPRQGNRDLCHKLGSGKPLGLGSVKIEVEQVLVRDAEWSDELSEKIEANYCLKNRKEAYTENSSVDRVPMELIELLDFKRVGDQHVSYPVGVKAGTSASYLWFVANRTSGEGVNFNNPRITYTLPPMKENNPENGKDLLLPAVNSGRFESNTAQPRVNQGNYAIKQTRMKAKINWINDVHGCSASCMLTETPQNGPAVRKAFLTTARVDLRNRGYKPGDEIEVAIVGWDEDKKNWRIRLA